MTGRPRSVPTTIGRRTSAFSDTKLAKNLELLANAEAHEHFRNRAELSE